MESGSGTTPVGDPAVDDRPDLWRVAALTAVTTFAGIILWTMLFAVGILIALSGSTIDAIMDVPSSGTASEELDAWIEDVTDALSESASALALAALVPPPIVWAAQSAAYVIAPRMLFRRRVAMGWAVLAAAAGFVGMCVGFFVDLMLAGMTVGFVGVAGGGLAAAVVLRAAMRPRDEDPFASAAGSPFS